MGKQSLGVGIGAISLVVLILLFKTFMEPASSTAFVMIFLSLFLEAFPFILLGTLLSSLVHVYVSEKTMHKFMPKNQILGVICAAFLGLVIPVCECAVIPVIYSLYKKNVPTPMLVTFLLSAPIINPLVILSTYYAFSDNIPMVIARIVVGVGISIVLGLLFLFLARKDIAKQVKQKGCAHGCHQHSHCHDHDHKNKQSLSFFTHFVTETVTLSKYFILGALFASLFNTFFPQSLLDGITSNAVLSILVLMGFAYVLSICSETDAFIARTFMAKFNPSAVLSFMTFGPMIDLKNTFMLSYYFKRSFVLLLIASIFLANFISTYFIELAGWL